MKKVISRLIFGFLCLSFTFLQGVAMAETKLATFAGGCFWCMEPPFDATKGVLKTTVGYAGGTTKNPTYKEITSKDTGHRESIQIEYDPKIVSYEKLVEVFWQNIDPTQTDGQFNDRGEHYKTAIYFHDDEQKIVAEKSKKELSESNRFEEAIATDVTKYTNFFPAEDYHQEYYKKNPLHYKGYSIGSGRKGFIKKTWGK